MQSFVTSFDAIGDETAGIKGGYTHECGGGDDPKSVIFGCATFEHTFGGAFSNQGGVYC